MYVIAASARIFTTDAARPWRNRILVLTFHRRGGLEWHQFLINDFHNSSCSTRKTIASREVLVRGIELHYTQTRGPKASIEILKSNDGGIRPKHHLELRIRLRRSRNPDSRRLRRRCAHQSGGHGREWRAEPRKWYASLLARPPIRTSKHSRQHPGIERRATAYGTAISGQGYKPSAKPLPSTARKPVVKRSNSTPASSKPTTGASTSSTPTKKLLPSSSSSTIGAKSTSKALPAAKPASKTLPKPYTPVGNLSYSSPGEKKTPVKPGQPKPFSVKEASSSAAEKKPYPGTNTLPGQGGKTPIKPKAPPRMKAPAERGKVQHISF